MRDGEGNRQGGQDGEVVGASPDPEDQARSIALRKLAAAPQTRAQLDEVMARRGVPEETRQRVLDRFSEVKLIDDAAFAAAWVESRHRGRGLARRALGHELRQYGVAPTVADQAVHALPPEREEETARQLVAKKLASTQRLDAQTRCRRLVSLLARKGYPTGLAYRIVREMLEAEGVDGSSLPDHIAAE